MPAWRMARTACWSVLPSTSGTVTVAGWAVVVVFGCVVAGAVVAGAAAVVAGGVELFGPDETLSNTCAPPDAFSPAFGFWATTVPTGSFDGTRWTSGSKPAAFSS